MKTIYKKLLFFLLMLPLSVLAQNTVDGVVVDSKTKQPLPGVNVIVKGTQMGTSTDFDGKFKLSKLKDGDVLLVSFIGYKNESVTFTGQKSLTVSLDEEANLLQEVVVQVGYGSVKKKDATGAVDLLTTKEFNRGFNSNTEALLNGRVAGVVVTQGGRPGDGAAIRIRGGASLQASNDPLIVLDGLPIDGNLQTINPNDIESISILKDASATAIYGNRGSNGVVLVTTKKGVKGDLKVTVGTVFTVNTLAEKINTTSAADYRSFITNPANIAQYNIAPSRLARLGNSNTNWQDEIFSNSVSIDNNVSMRGALFGKLPTSFSYGHTYLPGILETSKFDRTTASLRLNPSLFKDHLKIAINGNLSVVKERFADEGAISNAINFDPTQPVTISDQRFGGYFEWLDGSNNPNFQASDNPVAKLQQRNNNTKRNRYYGNVQLDYKLHFLPELKFTVLAGIDREQSKGRNDLNNQSINGVFNGPVNLGSYNEFWNNRTNTALDAYVNYTKAFGKLNVDVTAGHTYYERNNVNYSSGELRSPTNVINSLNTFTSPVSKLESYFGRANIGFDNKYLVTLNLRNDITNNFYKDVRSGVFPGAAFAWNVSNENFLKDSKSLTNLKLRLGWGTTGQQELSTSFSYIPQYVSGNNTAQYQFGTTLYTTVRPSFYSNTVKWEETTTYNAGLDFELFKKVKGTLDVYQKKTKDLLAFVAYPDGANLTNFGPRNFGNLEVKGLELGLNFAILKSTDLNWNINFNANYQDRKITATALDGTDSPGFFTGGIRGGVGNTIQINSTGYAPGAFYVYEQVYGTDGKPLEGVYVDRNGDGLISPKDMYQHKKPYADFTFGLMSNFSYKNWDLSMAWRASLGNYMYDNNGSSYGYLDNSINQITPLNNINPSFFETGFVNEGNNRYFSDYYVKDASFIKLDNISIGYNITEPFGKSTTAKLSFGVQNALIISKYKGLDPEILSGIDQTIYPRARMYVIGCNVNF
jgi:TonB-linked SusC/RagA family outer membrane protein